MKKILPLICTCIISLTVSAQEVVNAEDQGVISRTLLGLVLPFSPQYDVESFKITYTTTDAFGQPDTATGLLSLPSQDALVLPVALYNHGTIASADLAPSVPGVRERFAVQGLAGSGFIALAPDYLGLGDSDGIHPYLHAETEARAGRDMIIAVKRWLDAQDIRDNDQLFVTGYSQGGHASMALARSLENNGADDGLELTAAAHLSGVYDITPPSPGILVQDNPNQVLLSFFLNTVISYNYVYNLYGTPAQLFNEPYLTEVQKYIDRETDLYSMGSAVYDSLRANEARVGEIFVDQFVTDVLDDNPDLLAAYNDNDLLDYVPSVPTLLYYCDADETVNPQNSILTAELFIENGADSILLENGGNLSHSNCAIPALVRALQFFQGFSSSFPVSLGEPAEQPEIVLSPNPVRAGSRLAIDGLPDEASEFVVYDFSGRGVVSGRTSSNQTIKLPSSLDIGTYILRVGLEDGTSLVRRFQVR